MRVVGPGATRLSMDHASTIRQAQRNPPGECPVGFRSREIPTLSTIVAVAASVGAALPLAAEAASLQTAFVTIADTLHTTVPGPGSTPQYSGGFNAPNAGNGGVAFAAYNNHGVYAYTPSLGLRYVADGRIALPSGRLVSRVGEPEVSGSVVRFSASDGNDVSGIYGRNVGQPPGGTVAAVVTNATPVPGGTGSFFTSAYAVGSGATVFSGYESGAAGTPLQGLWASRASGIDLLTPLIPAAFAVSNGNVAMQFEQTFGVPENSSIAVLSLAGGPITTLVATGMAAPDGGTFTGLRRSGSPAFQDGLSYSAGELAFLAYTTVTGAANSAVFTTVGGLRLVADANTPLPGGGTCAFSAAARPFVSISQRQAAFLCNEPGGLNAIYLWSGDEIFRLIGVGDALGGSVVSSLGMTDSALDGNSLAFMAYLQDGVQGIYRANLAVVPVPPAVALFGSALAALVGLRRTRRAAL